MFDCRGLIALKKKIKCMIQTLLNSVVEANDLISVTSHELKKEMGRTTKYGSVQQ